MITRSYCAHSGCHYTNIRHHSRKKDHCPFKDTHFSSSSVWYIKTLSNVSLWQVNYFAVFSCNAQLNSDKCKQRVICLLPSRIFTPTSRSISSSLALFSSHFSLIMVTDLTDGAVKFNHATWIIPVELHDSIIFHLQKDC